MGKCKWGIDGYGENPVATIKTIKDRWVKAKHDLEDAEYLEDLIHRDFIRSVKHHKTTWDYRIPTIQTAVNELEITDGRKKKPSLNCLNSWVKRDFFPEVDVDIKVDEILRCGYEGYHWKMRFKINDEAYYISVPDKGMIDMDNAQYAYEGQFAFLHRTDTYSITVEYTDYTEEGMANFIKAYFR